MKIPSPVEMKLLLLAQERLPGVILAKAFQIDTGKPIPHGTLYTSLRRMRSRGWVSVKTKGRSRLFKTTVKGEDAIWKAKDYYNSLVIF